MEATMRAFLTLGMALAALSFGAMAAAARADTFTAQLTSPSNPNAKGTATVTVDPNTSTAKWTVNYSGLSGPATMAHIHGPADPGQNAPPIVWLSPKGQPVPDPIQGQEKLTNEQWTELRNGKTYVNIHTQQNPNGEIRGQLQPSRR
jgi:hypothetical protein